VISGGRFDNPSPLGDDEVLAAFHHDRQWQNAELSIKSRRLSTGTTVNDDAELIAQTLQGQPASFGVLVRKYQDRLYNAVVHTMGNAEDARDAVQEALVQAFLRLETFQHSSAFYTWLYRIAFNVAASHRRRKHLTTSVDQTREATGQEPIDTGPDPADQIEKEERRQQVRQAIAQLTDEHRAVLVLRDMEGFCYEEIADILSLPVGTVRSRLHRARMQLRDILKGTLTLD
jgi:RNA polymerase sigma-70 factor, ECF subfamily